MKNTVGYNTIALLFGFTLVLGSMVTLVSAQETSVETEEAIEVKAKPRGLFRDLRDVRKEIKGTVRDERKEIREDRKDLRDKNLELNKNIRDTRLEFNAAVRATSSAMRADFLKLKDAMKQASSSEERKNIIGGMKDRLKAFRTDVRSDRKEMREDFKEDRMELKTERQRIAAKHFNLVIRRLTTALEYFTKILARIDSRIEKLKARGVDVVIAASASETAHLSIDDARAAIVNAQAAIDAAVASEAPRDHLPKIREAVKVAIEAVKKARRAITDAILALKKIARPPKVEVGTEAAVEVDN